ncbi:DEAD/DEAH box helicase [Pseudofrancisella aestuarii]|uniref:DEAD/DEAH box helicase n=1 Tax=Pseudofrancisella aestuarii TaxID=2670347 RepID=A0ABV9TCG3_9GAMM|nr:DEAD/DEAH box helicase [Pseudofrancisella aestuarii]
MSQKFEKTFLSNYKNKILTNIIKHLEDCDEFVISVAFITLSGVACILESLRKLEKKGVKGKILTGCYLNFTEPQALKKLSQFKNIELKIITEQNFHAKGFFFRKDNIWNVIVGSTNLTQSALTVNTEWNIFLPIEREDDFKNKLFLEFEDIFDKAAPLEEILEKYEPLYELAKHQMQSFKLSSVNISPNQVQKEALISLENLRKEGESKALIISATGTGKTFLSAFDVQRVKPKRCLFVVHRTNIAIKAKETFESIIKNERMGLLSGGKHDQEADYLFATVQTLKNPNILSNFKQTEFDYIIIDEVHHAEAKSYKKILDYFSPQFLLGMTATPERTDNADIFKLFDHNIAYEIRLQQALEQKFLCPFHYFAIEDLYVDSEKNLLQNFNKLVSDERVDHIVNKINFYGYSGNKRSALMFVSNMEEAFKLANKLTDKGVKSIALTSKSSEKERFRAIEELENGDLEIIVTVDIFNEGIDIPCVNQVILLRPTQSSIVYIQQLGRGLRKFESKEFVVVLDFIANYENNFLIPVALSQNNSYDKDQLKQFLISATELIPGESTITFTELAKEIIYKNIQQANFTQLKNIKRDYNQLKKELGRNPSLLDFEKYNFISPEILLSYKDTYYDLLVSLKENEIPKLSSEEYNILRFISKEFSPAKRLYETLILKKLLIEKEILINEIKDFLRGQIIDFNEESFENSIKHLSLEIFTINAGRESYGPLITIKNNKIRLLPFVLIKNNSFLKKQIKDLLEYNDIFYSKKYRHDKSHGLALYSKYSKKDIAFLLNQDYTNGGVNLAGYRFFDDKALLFMTFDENKKFSRYDNKFLSKNTFIFYSKLNKKIDDSLNNNETGLAQNKFVSYVFVRVNKTDEYYFVGIVEKCLEAKNVTKDNSMMIEYAFQLERDIPQVIWQYFESIQDKKKD